MIYEVILVIQHHLIFIQTIFANGHGGQHHDHGGI